MEPFPVSENQDSRIQQFQNEFYDLFKGLTPDEMMAWMDYFKLVYEDNLSRQTACRQMVDRLAEAGDFKTRHLFENLLHTHFNGESTSD